MLDGSKALTDESSCCTHVVVPLKQLYVPLVDGVVEVLEVSCRQKPARLSHLRIGGQTVVSAPMDNGGHAVTVEV